MPQRSQRDVINRFKEYRDKPECMEAMADILLFLEVPEALYFLEQAQTEIQGEKEMGQDLRAAYKEHLKKGARHYMSFEAFCEIYGNE